MTMSVYINRKKTVRHKPRNLIFVFPKSPPPPSPSRISGNSKHQGEMFGMTITDLWLKIILKGQLRRYAENRRVTAAPRGHGPQGHLFEKTKNPLLDKVYGSICTKPQVSIVFRLARSPDPHKCTHIQVK